MKKIVRLQTLVFILIVMFGVASAPTSAQERPTVPDPLVDMPSDPSTPRPFGTSLVDALSLPQAVGDAARPEPISYREPRATFRVTSILDSPDSDIDDGLCLAVSGECTLRAAVMQASASSAGVVILPGGDNYALTIPTDVNDSSTGDLNIRPGSTVIIRSEGIGSRPNILGNSDPTNGFRVFSVAGTLILDGVSVSSGRTTGFGGCILVTNGGVLSFSNGYLYNCRAGVIGGAVGMEANTYVEVSNASVFGNTALGVSAIGTGFATSSFSSLVMTNVEISGNNAVNGDSAIGMNHGWLTLTNVTVSGNVNTKPAVSTDIRIAGVSASPAAANALVFNHVTITDNSSGGTDVGLTVYGSTHSLQFRNSILADNVGGAGAVNVDCDSGSFTGTALNMINSLVTNINGCTHSSTNLITGVSPQLLSLGSHGSPNLALTHALAPTSPALDYGAPEFCTTTDARSVLRSYGTGCDIGAYELITDDLLANGGFEPVAQGEACVLPPWVKNTTYGQDRARKTSPRTGECAFRFLSRAGKATAPGVLRQNMRLDTTFQATGNNVTFRAFVNVPMTSINATARLRVTYTDGTPATVANFPVIQTAGYSLLTGSAALASSNVQRVQLRFIDRTTSGGSWFIDDVRVFASKVARDD